MGNESEDLQAVVNMTGYPKVFKAALDTRALAELEFAMHRLETLPSPSRL